MICGSELAEDKGFVTTPWQAEEKRFVSTNPSSNDTAFSDLQGSPSGAEPQKCRVQNTGNYGNR